MVVYILSLFCLCALPALAEISPLEDLLHQVETSRDVAQWSFYERMRFETPTRHFLVEATHVESRFKSREKCHDYVNKTLILSFEPSRAALMPFSKGVSFGRMETLIGAFPQEFKLVACSSKKKGLPVLVSFKHSIHTPFLGARYANDLHKRPPQSPFSFKRSIRTPFLEATYANDLYKRPLQ